MNRAPRRERPAGGQEGAKAAATDYAFGWYDCEPERIGSALHDKLVKRAWLKDSDSGAFGLSEISKETLVNLLSRVAEGALMPGDIAAAVREAAASQRASHSVADDSNASVVRARDLGPNVIGRRLRADEGASIRAVML